jgi:putative ABC transport system permease protein
MLRGLVQDVRYAARVMLKSRALTLVAVATLALGIGANTAIFSVINALLLRPLPYPEADRLVMVWQDLRPRGGPATEWTGPSQQFDWKAETAVFENLTSVRGWNAMVGGGDLPETFVGEQSTYEYFDVLKVRPALGRTFRQSDDMPNAPRVVVLSDRVWRDRFGSDPSVVGRTIKISGENHEIIGVMPPDFTSAYVTDAVLWRPLRMNPTNPSRNSAVNHTIGRLAPGMTIDQARARLVALAKRLERDHPDTDTGKSINPVLLQEQKVGAVKPALFMLQGAVAFVLLIACVNIANLLLSRAFGRTREIAVRRALGADRARIIRQMLTESVLLALVGGALGILAGVWGVSALTAIAPAGTPRLAEIGVDRNVLGFAVALSFATGLVFGLVPAVHAARGQFSDALKQGGRGQMGDGGGRARRALVVAELALALVLLVGGGLMLRTFLALQRADLGFNPDHVVSGFVLTPPAVYRTAEQRLAFYDALLERSAALPGVRQAALSSVIPLGGDSDTNFEIEGRPRATRSADALVTWYRDVSANYFSTMGIPVRKGRLIAEREAEPTAVINETAANRFWGAEDPIGRRIRFDQDGAWFTIVGIVADVRVRGPRAENVAETYVGYWKMPEAGTNVVLKAAGNPAALAEPLRRAVKELDAGISVSGIASMEEMIAEANGPTRFYATLVAIFAALALLLAAVGIYGVMSYAVTLRTQEIGVRLALGATARQIFGLVVGESLKLAAVGLVLGVAGAIAVGRAMDTLLFGVAATDILTFGLTAAVLTMVAVLASYMPARRAMRTDPMTALRTE